MVAATRTRSISSPTRIPRSAARFWTARARYFMDLGFDGASMGEIARAAGVSKGTLYVYFADKNRLFEAIVEEESLEQGKVAFNFDPARDVETTLPEFGRAYIQLLCRPGGGSAIRTVMAIAERMPEVGRRFYDNVLAKHHQPPRGLSSGACAVRRSRDRRLPSSPRRNSCRCARRRCSCRSSSRPRPRPRPSASAKSSTARRGCFWRRIG